MTPTLSRCLAREETRAQTENTKSSQACKLYVLERPLSFALSDDARLDSLAYKTISLIGLDVMAARHTRAEHFHSSSSSCKCTRCAEPDTQSRRVKCGKYRGGVDEIFLGQGKCSGAVKITLLALIKIMINVSAVNPVTDTEHFTKKIVLSFSLSLSLSPGFFVNLCR